MKRESFILFQNLFNLFAATSNEKNILNIVSKQDDLVYAYDDTSGNAHNNSVQLLFNKESSSKKAKLILTIKNSFWIDYILNKMMEGYGVYYPLFVKKQQQRPAAQLQAWMKAQKIPLTVSVLTTNGWQKITEILPVGPQAFRKTITIVDLENMRETGFMYN